MQEKLGWKTARKDLVERVRVLSFKDTKRLLKGRTAGLGKITHQDALNRLMILLLEGAVSEDELPPIPPQDTPA